jgi:hypothetical protein
LTIHFCCASLIIRYKLCAKPDLKPNPRGGTAMKIMSSPYKKFVEATQKKENQTGH